MSLLGVRAFCAQVRWFVSFFSINFVLFIIAIPYLFLLSFCSLYFLRDIDWPHFWSSTSLLTISLTLLLFPQVTVSTLQLRLLYSTRFLSTFHDIIVLFLRFVSSFLLHWSFLMFKILVLSLQSVSFSTHLIKFLTLYHHRHHSTHSFPGWYFASILLQTDNQFTSVKVSQLLWPCSWTCIKKHFLFQK